MDSKKGGEWGQLVNVIEMLYGRNWKLQCNGHAREGIRKYNVYFIVITKL